MDLRQEHPDTTNETSPASSAPTPASTPPTMTAPPPSPTTIALSLMLAHRHPFNSFTPRPLHSQHQHGIKIPTQHVFGQPTPLPPPAPKSRLRLPRMADRAFSQYTRRRETILPNPHKEDLYRLNGYCKNVESYRDRASWDFGDAMPKPVRFKSAWTGAAPKSEKEVEEDMGYDGCDEREEEDQEEWETEDDKAEDEAHGEDNEDWSDVDTDDTEDNEDERPRGKWPTPRRCTNGLGR